MNQRIGSLALVVGLTLFGVGTLQAGDSTPVKASEASVGSVIALPVISILVGGSVLFGFEDQRGLLSSVTDSPKPAQAKVAAVHQRDDGSREVELVARETADGTTPVRAKLVFPAREDGTSEPLAVGDALDFKPSSGGSGWIVHHSGGAAIAFLPTPQAQHDGASERL